MLELKVTTDFSALERSLLRMSKELGSKAAATAVARTAARARLDVREALPRVFNQPTPFTMSAVRYRADASAGEATVFISPDGAKGTPPERFLAAEIAGGVRGVKRSERALMMAGMMDPDQRWVPGQGARLDPYGNVAGATLVQILSRVSAFGQHGYAANISKQKKSRYAKLKMAVRSTGTDYFIGKNKDGRPGAVYRLAGPGDVRPVLFFVDREPHYRKRFAFVEMVHKSVTDIWPKEMRRAFYETMEILGLKAR